MRLLASLFLFLLLQVLKVIEVVLQRVDDELDLLVCEQVHDVRAAFMELLYALRGDACAPDEVIGAAGGDDLEAVFGETLGNFYDL